MATYLEIVAHSAYDMFSWYKYLIVNLVFSHLGFWSGNLFLIATFPDLCLLVLFSQSTHMIHEQVPKETTKAKYNGFTIDKTLSWRVLHKASALS